jgi:hypothetical protein
MKEAFTNHRFLPRTLAVIDQINAILDEYQAQGFSLTLRQLFYQFVARGIMPNTLKTYTYLGATLRDGRLAGLIDWDAIEDRTRETQRCCGKRSSRSSKCASGAKRSGRKRRIAKRSAASRRIGKASSVACGGQDDQDHRRSHAAHHCCQCKAAAAAKADRSRRLVPIWVFCQRLVLRPGAGCP